MSAPTQNDLDAVARGRIASQYRESQRLLDMVSVFVAELTDAQEAAFYSLASLNLDDATGWGLDVIGAIVGVPRPTIEASIFGYFGFAGAGGELGYGDAAAPEVGGRYLSIFSADAGGVPLDDADYRLLIRARILRNQTSATPEEVLETIHTVFDSVAPVTIVESPVAAAQITFGRLLSTVEKGIVTGTDLIPFPITVELAFADSLGAAAFGYAGSVGSGYGSGTYASAL